MSSFCLCSDMITAEYLYSYAALSLCTIIVRNRESCKITVRFAMHRILADCTNSRGISRACLKKAFRELRVPVCGRFYPNEGGVAGYGNRMRAKYTAKWGLQIAEMIFQTRSRARSTPVIPYRYFSNIIFSGRRILAEDCAPQFLTFSINIHLVPRIFPVTTQGYKID